MVVERLLVRSIVFGRVVVGLSGVVELERVRCVPSCGWARQWACIPAASRAAAARGQRRAESPTSPSRRHSAACRPGSLARGHPCCPLFLSCPLFLLLQLWMDVDVCLSSTNGSSQCCQFIQTPSRRARCLRSDWLPKRDASDGLSRPPWREGHRSYPLLDPPHQSISAVRQWCMLRDLLSTLVDKRQGEVNRRTR